MPPATPDAAHNKPEMWIEEARKERLANVEMRNEAERYDPRCPTSGPPYTPKEGAGMAEYVKKTAHPYRPNTVDPAPYGDVHCLRCGMKENHPLHSLLRK